MNIIFVEACYKILNVLLSTGVITQDNLIGKTISVK